MDKRFLWNSARLLGLTAALSLVVAACGGGDATATPAPRATATPRSAAPTATPVPQLTATPTGPTPKYGGIFRMRVAGSYADLWDTYNSSGAFATLITLDLLSNLTSLDPVDGLTLRPDLAQSWAVSQDGKSVTYQLRKDVKWHDGRPFTSKDVLYSLGRAKTPVDPKATLHTANMRVVESFAAADDYTFTANLATPSASFLMKMSIPTLTIYPAHVPVERSPGGWLETRVGTGPFSFKEHKASVISELRRFDGYFKKDAAGRALPYLDAVRHIWIPDRALTISAFKTGELDCACGYTSDIIVPEKDGVSKAIPNVKFGATPSSMGYFFFNSRPPFDNIKVRQAISATIDRKQATEIYRSGAGVYPPTYFVPADFGGKLSLPTSEWLATPGFRVKDGKKDPADLALAKQLWAEAGVDPSSISIRYVATLGGLVDYSELSVAVLGQTGLKIVPNIVEPPAQAAILGRGDFDMNLIPASNGFEDPADILIPRTTTTGPLNYGKWSNPKIDELSAAQERELDATKRRQIMFDLQREHLKWAVLIPLSNLPSIFAAQPYVEGFALDRAFNQTSAHRLDTVWFNK